MNEANEVITKAKVKDAAELQNEFGDQHPTYTIEMWRAGPNEEHNSNGYWDWVASMLEAEAKPKEEPMVQVLADVESFGNLVVGWFDQRKHDLNHLLSIPVGTEVQMFTTDPAVPAENIILDEKLHAAFRLGVHSAMVVLGDLPFGRISNTDGADPEVNTEVANDKPA